jgi:septum site-determining protein MinD
MATVINVVSGKGGTGKTLMSAVLADMLGGLGLNVVVVDLDIFVRGLTVLLYFHKRESLNLISAPQASVADLFINKNDVLIGRKYHLGISRYRSFDVLPAVHRIDQTLSFADIAPNSRAEATKVLEVLLNSVPKTYDVVILDSRAGYDELIAATHSVSTASICVEEEDSISRVTADNLINQLKSDAPTPLFRLTNKARKIETLGDLEREPRGITELGRVPFDIDVMNSFGEEDFWEGIGRSLYRVALSRAWNRFAAKLGLQWELKETRLSPFASDRIEVHLATFTLRDRVLLVYGLLLGVSGLVLGFFDRDTLMFFFKDPIRVMAVAIGLVGLAMTVYAILRLGRRPRDATSLKYKD